MRVTHRMIADKVNVTLQQNLLRLQERSEQLASGKHFQRPCQDPVAINRAMRFRDSMGRNERYRLNIGEAKGWLDTTEAALMDGLEMLERIGELCIYGANSHLTRSELEAIAEEVRELYEHMVGIGNTEYNGLYIFGGHRTGEPPYREGAEGLEYRGDGGNRRLEISPHQEMVMNINGERAFGGTKLMVIIDEVGEALRGSRQEELSGEALREVNQGIDYLLERLAEIGARQKRLEVMDDTLFESNIHLRKRLSVVEDVDLALAYTEYVMEEYAYKAALSTAAKTLQPTLVDYLS